MKRWIIRSFFIGLLLLFGGGWAVSYKFGWEIRYLRQHDMWSLFGHWGEITLVWWDESRSEKVDKSGLFIVPANADAASSYFMQPDVRRCLGFYLKFDHDEKFIAIPFWFPTTISAALLCWVWRKT